MSASSMHWPLFRQYSLNVLSQLWMERFTTWGRPLLWPETEILRRQFCQLWAGAVAVYSGPCEWNRNGPRSLNCRWGRFGLGGGCWANTGRQTWLSFCSSTLFYHMRAHRSMNLFRPGCRHQVVCTSLHRHGTLYLICGHLLARALGTQIPFPPTYNTPRCECKFLFNSVSIERQMSRTTDKNG